MKEFSRQLYFVANGSLPIVLFCVGFAAIVTILEASFHMKLVIQNDSMVPGFAALLILRELGPVVTALLLTSRVGAGFTAEVGLMKTTEQIDALRMLGIDPVQYLVVPRLIATIVGTFLLALLASMTCLLGAMFVTDIHLGYSPAMFLSSMRVFVDFQDLLLAGLKGAVFGAVIPLVSCHFGFLCEEGAEGVGKATTQSVVVSSVSIIVLDFILSYVFSYV
ncbi:MAG: ABC transporter permease [Bdellovibrionaceae bacterium]|nr:ABC transporter permease [Pseudobdellovibrionaceae bacterium]MBX3041319.1 ABC transporter permease [Pseudobdellovibrionaceae bacterium]